MGVLVSPDSGVDVIIRYHRVDRTLELDIALASLFNQTYSPIHVIIVTQNFSAQDLRVVRDLLSEYDWETRHVAPTVVNVESPSGLDVRSKLLNAGIARTRQRYLAILDYDDLLYSHAYEHLISVATKHDAAVSFGGIVVKHVCVFESFVWNLKRIDDYFRVGGLEDLIHDNFCPIHSFIVDMRKINIADISFNENLTRLEDYDFLLRLAEKYKFSFEGIGRKIGVYNFHLDGSNSSQVFLGHGPEYEANARQWNDARRHIWRLKNRVKDKLKISA